MYNIISMRNNKYIIDGWEVPREDQKNLIFVINVVVGTNFIPLFFITSHNLSEDGLIMCQVRAR